MTTAIQYSLTEYTDFRKLEFEYSKMRDENCELREKIRMIEEAYREGIEGFERQKIEWYKSEAKTKAVLYEAEQTVQDLIVFSQGIEEQLKNLAKMGIDLGMNLQTKDKEGKLSKIERMKRMFNEIVKCMMIAFNKNSDLALKYERESALFKNETKQNKRRQKDLKEQISYLSEEISKFETTNTSLMNEINILKRENMDYKLQIYEMTKLSKEESVIQTQRNDHIEDNNFALDLLNYEKELLQRIFAKMLSSLKNEAINEIMADIYESYEAVAQAFREKLQIQYDLQDLEREYKREKNSKVNQNLLIQLRKQIQDFRNELNKQKTLLNNEQYNLQRHFIGLQGVDKYQKKIRNYTIQIQKKLKDIKSYNETKRHSDDSFEPKSSRIQFKATAKNQDIMKEVVRRDRENIEKIFKQTRSNYNKIDVQ